MILRPNHDDRNDKLRSEYLYKPESREAALLLLRLIETKDRGSDRPTTRVRLAEITLKRLWNRSRLSDQFLAEVSEWLLTVGWALFFAGSTYAAVRTSAVENWPPISSKRIQTELNAVRAGKFDFAALEYLFDGSRGDDQVDDEDDRPTD